MHSRRNFLQKGMLGIFGYTLPLTSLRKFSQPSPSPIIISTWDDNQPANEAAWKILGKGGRALDAVVEGVQIPEADPKDTSVGYGGYPDRDGRVTVDSCVMDESGNCGAVMALEHILHPVLVARLVMERTPHVQLVGEGALEFALEQGFEKTELLTPAAEKAWKEWLKKSGYKPKLRDTSYKNVTGHDLAWPLAVNHDTIGMIALDVNGNLGGACTTSGMAWKMHGRVGDSPIIGAGLFVDNEVGAATATGVGEEVVKVCGAHTIIESMRNGNDPTSACKEAIRRIVKNKGDDASKIQVGFIAVNKAGEYGAFGITRGFTYVVTNAKGSVKAEAESWFG